MGESGSWGFSDRFGSMAAEKFVPGLRTGRANMKGTISDSTCCFAAWIVPSPK